MVDEKEINGINEKILNSLKECQRRNEEFNNQAGIFIYMQYPDEQKNISHQYEHNEWTKLIDMGYNPPKIRIGWHRPHPETQPNLKYYFVKIIFIYIPNKKDYMRIKVVKNPKYISSNFFYNPAK